MSKQRTLYRHIAYSLAPGELDLDDYKELSKQQRSEYRKRAKIMRFKPIWETLYTENDLRSIAMNNNDENE
jgi:hypothetical protein